MLQENGYFCAFSGICFGESVTFLRGHTFMTSTKNNQFGDPHLLHPQK